MKQKYTINCWCSVAKQYTVEAASEDEVKQKAWAQFENDDLNKCTLGDYGTDLI